MERLTTNKSVSEMTMTELAYNGCYAKDGKARYRDYGQDIDAREFARRLYKNYEGEELSNDDDVFDDEILEELQLDPELYPGGLIALFYRNLWVMADLREQLKQYEDAEERGEILRLPISEDTPVYSIEYCCGLNKNNVSGLCFRGFCEKCKDKSYYIREGRAKQCSISEINKTVFLTRAEAEQALAEKGV